MKEYLRIVKRILDEGEYKDNRTGVGTYTIVGEKFEHDMSTGFPLLTTKRVYYNGVKVELEGFIKGITDKKWYQERACHIWDEWCNREKIPYSHDEETKQRMREERDLGPIYGFQWRHWNAEYDSYDTDYSGKGVDQLENLVNTLKTNPNDRRMIVSAWNPDDPQMEKMALPPCHYGFQVIVLNNRLNLIWNQRSVDTMLGLPFNIASYATLLHLLAKESGFEEGKLIGSLGDTHIYENHLKGVERQLKREPLQLPRLNTENFTSIFDWSYDQTLLQNYKPHKRIKFEVAV